MTKRNIFVPCAALLLFGFCFILTQTLEKPKSIAAAQIDPNIAEIVWSR